MLDPSRTICYRRLPRLTVIVACVIGGIVLGGTLASLFSESFGIEEGCSSRATMYWLYKRGFHPSQSTFDACMAVLDTWRPLVLWITFSSAASYCFNFVLKRVRVPDVIRREGYCRPCGYDLSGNVTGICPECGTPIIREERDRRAGLLATICFVMIFGSLLMLVLWLLTPGVAR